MTWISAFQVPVVTKYEVTAVHLTAPLRNSHWPSHLACNRQSLTWDPKNFPRQTPRQDTTKVPQWGLLRRERDNRPIASDAASATCPITTSRRRQLRHVFVKVPDAAAGSGPIPVEPEDASSDPTQSAADRGCCSLCEGISNEPARVCN